jgi:hypothetical protein
MEWRSVTQANRFLRSISNCFLLACRTGQDFAVNACQRINAELLVTFGLDYSMQILRPRMIIVKSHFAMTVLSVSSIEETKC